MSNSDADIMTMNGVSRYMFLPHDFRILYGQIRYNQERFSKMPPRRPGDRYTLSGALIGIMTGIILIIVNQNLHYFLFSLLGGIAGTLIGSLIGHYVIKYHKSNGDGLTGV